MKRQRSTLPEPDESIYALQARLDELCDRRKAILSPEEGQRSMHWHSDQLSSDGAKELTAIDAEEKSILAELAALHAERRGLHAVRPRPVRDTLYPPIAKTVDVQQLFSWTMACLAGHVADLRNAKPAEIDERKRSAFFFSNYVRSAIAPLAVGFRFDGKAAQEVFAEAATKLRMVATGESDGGEFIRDDMSRLELKINTLLTGLGIAIPKAGSAEQSARLAGQTGEDPDGTIKAAAARFTTGQKMLAA